MGTGAFCYQKKSNLIIKSFLHLSSSWPGPKLFLQTNLLENCSHKVTKLKLVRLLHRNPGQKQSKLQIFGVNFGPILDYCSLVFSNIRYCDTVANENFQCALAKHLVGFPLNLNHVGCSDLLHLKHFWPQLITADLALFNDITINDS